MSSSTPEQTRALPALPCVAPAAEPREPFTSFYRTTLAPLRNYLARFMRDPAEAQDIAHDAYLKTYEAMHARPVEQPRSYLFTVARRLAINYQIGRSSRMQPMDDAALEARAETAPDVASEVIARQDAAALEAAVLSLPPVCRKVLRLRLDEGQSYEEIARTLGISVSTVSKHMSRAFQTLREDMKAYRDAAPAKATDWHDTPRNVSLGNEP